MSRDFRLNSASPQSSQAEIENRQRILGLMRASPLGDELIDNLALYMTRQSLMRLFYMAELYKLSMGNHGVVMEFGCKWGTNLSIWTALRGMYEPFNHNRKIVGFDTFEGLKGVSEADWASGKFVADGQYSTGGDYDQYLRELIDGLEKECPLNHIKKHEIIKGDVRESFPKYLKANPQTVISLAYFDMDIYEPTKAVLELMKPYVTKGTVIGIDEMNWDKMPGPTLAFKEVFGFENCRILHSPMATIPAYIVIE